MKRRSPLLALAALAGLALVSCGSGGGNVPMMGGAVSPTFTENPPMGLNLITMSAGLVSGDVFQIVIRVPDIDDFYGTAFNVQWDSAATQFLSFEGSLSPNVLQANAPNILINAGVDPNLARTVTVIATLTDFVQGLDTSTQATDVVITLTFQATATTGGTLFTFDPATRFVTTCTAMDTCADIPDMMLTWNGGVLTAN